jgi:hypothetical protein
MSRKERANLRCGMMDVWCWPLLCCFGGAANEVISSARRYSPQSEGRMHGASGPGGRCRSAAPHYSARECAAVHPGLRCRSQRLSGLTAAEHCFARGRIDRLLPDVQPCTPDRGTAEGRCSGGGAEERSRTLCRLLECKPSLDRPWKRCGIRS